MRPSSLRPRSTSSAFPDGVLDRRVVGVLGRDEDRLFRLGEQFPPPLCQRTRLCRGTGVLALRSEVRWSVGVLPEIHRGFIGVYSTGLGYRRYRMR
jgi:hypothetical protein